MNDRTFTLLNGGRVEEPRPDSQAALRRADAAELVAGKDRDHALDAERERLFKESLEKNLEKARRRGSIPTRKVQVTLPAALLEELQTLCDREGLTVSGTVRFAVRELLGRLQG